MDLLHAMKQDDDEEDHHGFRSENLNKDAQYLLWEDITVVTRNSKNGATRNLLSRLTGFAQSDRIMAVMGPSGSGKSTLLDALAGRLSANARMTGNVLLNGKKRSIDGRDISYVTQVDDFLGTLTVRETISYAAQLRLPSNLTKQEISNVVEDTISKMGLQECANSCIGNWHLRGISGGEKRRLSISVEILTKPSVLFLDEPTSGLDSAAAFFVIQALSNIAHHDAKIVVCSIHQPSIDVYDLFDDLLLLSGGETVFFGERKMVLEFFAEVGFPCPTRRNPPDHFLRCISPEFDKIVAILMKTQKDFNFPTSSDSAMNMTTKEITAALIKSYSCSKFSTNAKETIQEIKLVEEPVIESKTSHPSRWRQMYTLICRSSLNMKRDLGYYWLRIVFYIIVALSAGSFYFNTGTGSKAIEDRGKYDGFIYGLMICLSVGGVPFFTEEVKVFYREKFGGNYGEAAFVLSNFISSFPFVIVMSFSSGTILYYMVNFHPRLSCYLYFCMNIFCCITVTEGLTLLVASLVPDLLMAVGAATAVIIFLMLPSNIFRPLSDLPKIFWRYPMSYVSYASWAIQGHFKNDMVGLEFDPLVAGQPKLKGEKILNDVFGISPNRSKWWDLVVLVFFVIVHRTLLYIALKYKDKASSVFHEFCTKGTLSSTLLGQTPTSFINILENLYLIIGHSEPVLSEVDTHGIN